MKKRTYSFAALLLILVAAGFFLGRHIYLHRELPRTVENIAGEWFLRKVHVCNVDPAPDPDPDWENEWTDDFPTEEHDIFFTLCFDTGGLGCIKFKYEGPQKVDAWQYFWCLSGNTLVRWNRWEYDEYRIDRLTRSQLVLVIRRENLHGETYESTYYYERGVKNAVLSATECSGVSDSRGRYHPC